MNVRSFTLRVDSLLKEIITDVSVFDARYNDISSLNDPRVLHTNALWDTGATNCVITPSCARSLNLKPVGLTKTHHAGGESIANVYLVTIALPNGVGIKGVRVTECAEQSGSFGIIIGMDIITRGDFSISNKNGKTTVSFCIPSVHDIDFVEEGKKLNEANEKVNLAKRTKKIGRNEPCPCGSGKKYKNCHGK